MPASLRPRGAQLATTGLWYHRMCRAVSDDKVIGSMSRRLGAVDDAVAADVLSASSTFPTTSHWYSLRTVGWPMGELVHVGARLNLLSLEALAAARHLSAEICLAAGDDIAPLRATAKTFQVSIRTVKG